MIADSRDNLGLSDKGGMMNEKEPVNQIVMPPKCPRCTNSRKMRNAQVVDIAGNGLEVFLKEIEADCIFCVPVGLRKPAVIREATK